MPTTKVYDQHGAVKVDPLESGRIITVLEMPGNAESHVAFEVPTEKCISQAVIEQHLKVFERENMYKPVPMETQEELFCNSNDKSKGPNETYPGTQSDTRTDFGKNIAPSIRPNSIPRS